MWNGLVQRKSGAARDRHLTVPGRLCWWRAHGCHFTGPGLHQDKLPAEMPPGPEPAEVNPGTWAGAMTVCFEKLSASDKPERRLPMHHLARRDGSRTDRRILSPGRRHAAHVPPQSSVLPCSGRPMVGSTRRGESSSMPIRRARGSGDARLRQPGACAHHCPSTAARTLDHVLQRRHRPVGR